MDIHKLVIPTPYTIGDVNAFLVKGDTLTLFDAGPKTTKAYEALKWGIQSCGYEMSDIEQVVLTHHHPDHVGWVDAFPKAHIVGHAYVDHWLRQKQEFLDYRSDFYRYHLIRQAVPEEYVEKIVKSRGELDLFGTTPLTHFMQDGDEVPGHPDLYAIYTPGHAQSHFIFHDKKTNTVIGGDLLLQSVAPNPLVEPPVSLSFERPKSMVQYQESLLKLRNLEAKKVYAGHGEDIVSALELISLRLDRDLSRCEQVYQLLDQPKAVFDITKQLYPSIYISQLGLTLSKTIGYLDLLERDGRVQSEQVGDVYMYSRT
jgi:glyoxylase-like metal-dependent hydrolase (beta-lactamase superfamily II)